MTPSNNNNSFKEIFAVFKEGLHSPAKALVWSKAFREVGRVGVGLGVFGAIILGLFCLVFSSHQERGQELKQASDMLSPQFADAINFIDTGKRSLEAREEILKELMTAIDVPAGQSQSQGAVEQKLHTLSSLLARCQESRSTFVSALSMLKNPSLNPEISNSFERLIDDGEKHFADEKPSLITFQEESAHWGNLCFLCESEVKKAQATLQNGISRSADGSLERGRTSTSIPPLIKETAPDGRAKSEM